MITDKSALDGLKNLFGIVIDTEDVLDDIHKEYKTQRDLAKSLFKKVRESCITAQKIITECYKIYESAKKTGTNVDIVADVREYENAIQLTRVYSANLIVSVSYTDTDCITYEDVTRTSDVVSYLSTAAEVMDRRVSKLTYLLLHTDCEC